MSMRPQDVLVAVKLALSSKPTYPELAAALEMSLSEVHGSVKRATAAGLVGPDRTANRVALLEFLLTGVRHAFVPIRGELTRGMPTAHGAPPLDKLVSDGVAPPPVWPDPEGKVRGESFSPLYRSVPKAAKKDPKLYEALCLIDALRGGRPRDRALAEQHLRRLFAIRESFAIAAPHREHIARSLAKIGPGPESFYRSALEILDRPLPATSHLVAHLAREIDGSLRQVLNELREVEGDSEKTADEPSNSGKHRESIRLALSVLGIAIDGPIGEAWLGFTGRNSQRPLHAWAHRDQLNPPRPLDADFLRVWATFEQILEQVLDGLDKRYVIVLERLDRLLATPSPTSTDAQLLRGSLPQSQVALEYFFGKLDDPKWILPLAKVGFFALPPPPVRDSLGESHPAWPALRYLERMASRAPQEVTRIALAVPTNDNSTVHQAMIRTVLGLPPELAAKFADRVDGWLANGGIDPDLDGRSEGVIDLIVKLATGGQGRGALQVLHSLLRPVQEPAGAGESRAFQRRPETRLTTWGLKRAMQRLSPVITSLGEPAFVLLCDLLEEAIELSFSGTTLDERDDQSWIWRPAIEDHARNRDSDLLSMLVGATRDAAAHLIEADSTRLPEIVVSLESRRRVVFHRLALHLLVLFGSASPDLVSVRVGDRSSFESHEIEHEYARLLRTSFDRLGSRQQADILSWIHEGPTASPQEDRTGYAELWTLRWLTVVADVLPFDWRARFDALMAKHGPQTAPDELPSIDYFSRPASPILHEDLAGMAPDQMVEVVTSFKASSETADETSAVFSRQIAAVVEQKPDIYATNADILKRLDPTALCGVFSGFASATAAGRSFDWQAVLDLCVWASAHPRGGDSWRESPAERKTHWGETRKAVLWLLQSGMKATTAEIPVGLRASVWAAIEPTLDDPDGRGRRTERTRKREASSRVRRGSKAIGFTTEGPDPMGEASRRVQGIALHTAIDYALWLARHLPSKALPADVRGALEAKLPDPSDASRAVYGSQINALTFLDTAWCKLHVRAMFARDDDGHDPAWDTYLEYSRLTPDVFKLLRWRYKLAVEELGPDVALDAKRKKLTEHVGDRLIILYWHGTIAFRDRDALLEKFFANAPPSIAGRSIARVGHGLRDEMTPSAEVVGRLKTLWEMRASLGRREELAAFGPWFASGRLDDDWGLRQLEEVLRAGVLPLESGRVVERLAVLASAPRWLSRVLGCLDLLVQVDRRGMSIYYWRAPARVILTATRASDNRLVRGAAETVINRLLEAGYVEFRDLL